MNNRERYIEAVETMRDYDLDGYAEYLDDDMSFEGPFPHPLGKDAYLNTLRTMINAFPDLDYHYRVIDVDGNHLRYASYFSGTHTGDLDLSAQGMGIIPPTGKSFETAEEEGEVWFTDDGKVERIVIHPEEGGGVQGMLGQLGVQPG
jgi:predicted ester cyclase